MLTKKEYIYAVYQERSFSRAAQKLYVSQPWLSTMVKKVELALKTQLFDRTTNPISLTPAGEYYIQQVEKIIAIEQEMRQYFQKLNLEQPERLTVGSSMFFCTYVLPRLTEPFQVQYPNVTLTFREGICTELQQELLAKKLDMIVEAEKIEDENIQVTPWAAEEIVLAVPARFEINRRLAKYQYSFDELLKRDIPGHKKPSVPLGNFRDEQFLFLRPGNDIYERSMKLCEHASFPNPNVKFYLSQMMTAYYLACEGHGVTFLRSTIPEYVTPTDSIVFYQLDDPIAFRNLYISYAKQHVNPAQRQMIEFLNNTMLKLQEQFYTKNRLKSEFVLEFLSTLIFPLSKTVSFVVLPTGDGDLTSTHEVFFEPFVLILFSYLLNLFLLLFRYKILHLHHLFELYHFLWKYWHFISDYSMNPLYETAGI